MEKHVTEQERTYFVHQKIVVNLFSSKKTCINMHQKLYVSNAVTNTIITHSRTRRLSFEVGDLTGRRNLNYVQIYQKVLLQESCSINPRYK